MFFNKQYEVENLIKIVEDWNEQKMVIKRRVYEIPVYPNKTTNNNYTDIFFMFYAL